MRRKPRLFKKIAMRINAWAQERTMRKNGIAFEREGIPFSADSKNGITVILNAYKRPGYLQQQVAALRAQSVPPAQIWVWCNDSEKPTPDFSSLVDRVLVSNFNWKFFGRFTLASLAQTTYVAFFDDDILPQPLWFENCINTVTTGYDGILGGSGVLLPTEGYSAKQKIGWNGALLSQPTTVDLVGHAWFARKAHFCHLWREEPYSWDNGEDIHLSYTALKYGGVKTYVPPHPPDDIKLWSCDPDFGKIAGGGAVATYKRSDHLPIRNAAVAYYRKSGWRILADNE